MFHFGAFYIPKKTALFYEKKSVRTGLFFHAHRDNTTDDLRESSRIQKPTFAVP